MQRFKLVGLAMLAVLMFSAVATATASAVLPEILPVPTAGSPLNFKTETLSTNSILLTTAGSLISCKKGSSKGAFTTAYTGEGEIVFEECTANGTTTKCKSLGGTSGKINFKAEVELVTLPETTLSLGLLVLLPSALLHLECGVLLILVLGAVIGLFLNKEGAALKTLEKVETGFVDFVEAKSGLQKIRTCDEPLAICEEKGKLIEYLLNSEFGSGEELSGEATSQDVTLEKEVEIHF